MNYFKFYHSIEVRYGDLDPQGHVNNANYLTYIEQTRLAYIQYLGLWQADSFLDIGIILAEASVTFIKPIFFGQAVRIGARVTRLGNKSISMEYCLEDTRSGCELANGSAVLVAYDYRNNHSIMLPEHWRRIITEFEDFPVSGSKPAIIEETL